MSRNIADISCHQCPGLHEHIILDEAPRPVSEADVGPHWLPDYKGLIVAKAHCVLCHSLYLAWVDWPTSPYDHWHLKAKSEGIRFCDLSFRHAFNDEPGIQDTPLFHVKAVITYVRTVAKPEDHYYRNMDWGDEKWREKCRQQLALWQQRQDEVINSGLAPSDELARLLKPGASHAEALAAKAEEVRRG